MSTAAAVSAVATARTAEIMMLRVVELQRPAVKLTAHSRPVVVGRRRYKGRLRSVGIVRVVKALVHVGRRNRRYVPLLRRQNYAEQRGNLVSAISTVMLLLL